MDIPYRRYISRAHCGTALMRGSFVDSLPFKFLIGPAKRAFYVHSGLIEQHSDTLAALVGGRMVEARERCAHLEDTEEDTFIRFLEFAYTGDYSVPEPDLVLSAADIDVDDHGESSSKGKMAAANGDIRGSSEDGEEIEHAPVVDLSPPGMEQPPFEEEFRPPSPQMLESSWGFSKKDRKKKKKASSRWTVDEYNSLPPQDAVEIAYADDEMRSETIEATPPRKKNLWDSFQSKAVVKETAPWEPRVNSDHCEDYTNIFLCHASLYVLADRYTIEPLRELVLQKLRLTLSRFTQFSQRTGDIVELLKYIYVHTMDYDDGVDKLRSLVSEYAVCQIETVAKNKGFLDLLQEAGAMAKDIMVKMLQRLD